VTRRCAGGRWRVKADVRLPRKVGGILYGDVHSIGSSAEMAGEDREGHHATVLPDTELDEVVISRWFHLEQMGEGDYWMNISGLVVNVQIDRDGRPRSVMAELEPVEGVTYKIEP
jgi:hypothetical protein